MMMQWPSDPRVTVVVPSGPLDVAIEELVPSDDEDEPALEETDEPLPVVVVIVLPPRVVDDETLPFPAWTVVDGPEPPAIVDPPPFSTMQVPPSSVRNSLPRLTAAPKTSATPAKASTPTAGDNLKGIMICSSK
ncbi:MAG: hypothetical protein ACTHJ3_14985 [Pararhizobium sp.]